MGERLRIIAGLHALIAFLQDNPELPAPTSVDAWFHVDGGTNGARRDVVAAAATCMETDVQHLIGGGPYTEKVLLEPTAGNIIGVRYGVRTHLTDGTEAWGV